MNNGEDQPDICPLNPDYGHKFFVFKVYETYEPIEKFDDTQYYQKQEYAVLGCNCSKVVRKAVL